MYEVLIEQLMKFLYQADIVTFTKQTATCVSSFHVWDILVNN